MVANHQVSGQALQGVTTNEDTTASIQAGEGTTTLNNMSHVNLYVDTQILPNDYICASCGHRHFQAGGCERCTSEINGYKYPTDYWDTFTGNTSFTTAGDHNYADSAGSTDANQDRLLLDVYSETPTYDESSAYLQTDYSGTPRSASSMYNASYQAIESYDNDQRSEFAQLGDQSNNPSPLFERWYWTPERHEWIAYRMEQSPGSISFPLEVQNTDEETGLNREHHQ